jgi:hypothetical protein
LLRPPRYLAAAYAPVPPPPPPLPKTRPSGVL